MALLRAIYHSQAWKLLLFLQKVILVLSTLFVVFTLFAWVMLRYVFKTDLYGAEEIILIVAFWLYFIGTCYASYEKSHVRADILATFVNKRTVVLIRPVIYLLVIISNVIFCVWSCDALIFNITMVPKTIALGIPLYWGYMPIFIGYVLSLFYSIVYLVESVVKISLLLEGNLDLNTEDITSI